MKLSGHVIPSAARSGWWAERPAEDAEIYAFQVNEAVAVEWDVAASRMVVRRWTPSAGETVTERTYP